MLNTIK